MTHPTRTRTRTPWLSKLFGRRPRTPIRRAPQTRLGVECLEDRLVPANLIDLDGLRFMAYHGNSSIDFTENVDHTNGTQYFVGNEGDSVSVGFAPGTITPQVTVTAL